MCLDFVIAMCSLLAEAFRLRAEPPQQLSTPRPRTHPHAGAVPPSCLLLSPLHRGCLRPHWGGVQGLLLALTQTKGDARFNV